MQEGKSEVKGDLSKDTGKETSGTLQGARPASLLFLPKARRSEGGFTPGTSRSAYNSGPSSSGRRRSHPLASFHHGDLSAERCDLQLGNCEASSVSVPELSLVTGLGGVGASSGSGGTLQLQLQRLSFGRLSVGSSRGGCEMDSPGASTAGVSRSCGDLSNRRERVNRRSHGSLGSLGSLHREERLGRRGHGSFGSFGAHSRLSRGSERSPSPAKLAPGAATLKLLQAKRATGFVLELESEDFVVFREALLKGSLFCSHLKGASLLDLARQVELFRFSPGEAVVSQGDEGTHFFVVRSGCCMLLPSGGVSGSDVTTNNNSNAETSLLGPGCCFGEAAVLAASCPGASVQPASVLAGEAGCALLGVECGALRLALLSSAETCFQESMELLGRSQMFQSLDHAQRVVVCRSVFTQAYAAGVQLSNEGVGARDCLFLVKSGRLVVRTGVRMSTLGAGDCFGERALLFGPSPEGTCNNDNHNSNNMAVGAGSELELLAIPRGLLQRVMGPADLEAALWRAVLLAALREDNSNNSNNNDNNNNDSDNNSNNNNDNNNNDDRDSGGEALHHPPTGYDWEVLADACVIKRFPAAAGEEEEAAAALSAAELRSLRFLIVLEGHVRLRVAQLPADRGEEPSPRHLSLAQGERCGEENLLDVQMFVFLGVQGAVPGASFTLALLPKDAVTAFSTGARPPSPRTTTKEQIRKAYIFRHLSKHHCHLLSHSLRVLTRKQGEKIIEEGELSSQFFVILAGELEVSQQGRTIRTLGKFDYFGERGLLYRQPRSATVTCLSAETELLVISRTAFLQVVKNTLLQHLESRIELQQTDVQLADLQRLCIIGRGTFGVVQLVEHRSKGTRYALKCISRLEAVTGGQQENLRLEREILLELDHPFILKMVRSFKDQQCLYFLTEFVTGGELFGAIRSLGLLVREQAQFYAGSLILALEALHDRSIVYRDLKPENVLLDSQGFVKLIDFGCAAKLKGLKSSLVGTPHYMAPEVILSTGYGLACDVWSFGVCLFEFVCGPLPFGNDADNPKHIFREILSSRLCFPPQFADEAGRHLLRQLLRRPLESRLGSDGYTGIRSNWAAVKKHAYFQSFSFDRLLSRQLLPPLVPATCCPSTDEQGTVALSKCLVALSTSCPSADKQGPVAVSSTKERHETEDWDRDF